jgi:hypothetical protein
MFTLDPGMVLATNTPAVTTEWIPIDTLSSLNVDSGTIRVVRFPKRVYIVHIPNEWSVSHVGSGHYS